MGQYALGPRGQPRFDPLEGAGRRSYARLNGHDV